MQETVGAVYKEVTGSMISCASRAQQMADKMRTQARQVCVTET